MVLGSWQPSVPDLDGICIGVLFMLSYVYAVAHNREVMQHRLYFSTLVSDKGLRKLPDQNSAASCPESFLISVYFWIVEICHFFSVLAVYSLQEWSIMTSSKGKMIPSRLYSPSTEFAYHEDNRLICLNLR